MCLQGTGEGEEEMDEDVRVLAVANPSKQVNQLTITE